MSSYKVQESERRGDQRDPSINENLEKDLAREGSVDETLVKVVIEELKAEAESIEEENKVDVDTFKTVVKHMKVNETNH